MKKCLKYLFFISILIPVLAWADMIEMVDNDRVQYWDWDCMGISGDPRDSVDLYFSLNLDSGFVFVAAIGDSAQIIINLPETPLIIYSDSADTVDWIDPNDWNHQYWMTFTYRYFEGMAIPWGDTIHLAIPTEPGCGGQFHVD